MNWPSAWFSHFLENHSLTIKKFLTTVIDLFIPTILLSWFFKLFCENVFLFQSRYRIVHIIFFYFCGTENFNWNNSFVLNFLIVSVLFNVFCPWFLTNWFQMICNFHLSKRNESLMCSKSWFNVYVEWPYF